MWSLKHSDAAIDGVGGATVVVMSEAASINIAFAFQQRWAFHYFIWPTARVIVALLRRLHRSQVKEVYTSVACDIGDILLLR